MSKPTALTAFVTALDLMKLDYTVFPTCGLDGMPSLPPTTTMWVHYIGRFVFSRESGELEETEVAIIVGGCAKQITTH